MTKEEALKEFIGYQTYDIQPSVEATKMAIEALNQEPCEDCISRQAAIDAMIKIEQDDIKQYGCKILEGFDSSPAIKALDNLPSIASKPKIGQWIPVSERLPAEREWYLAVFKETDTEYQLIPRVADYIGNGENVWRIIDEDGLGQEYCSILECVAWMPLPEPYKVKSEEDNAKSEVEVCSSNFIQLKQDVLNNNQLWRKLREIENEDSD